MLRVGLTGGIATGKSYVRARLAEAGFHTIDLDLVAHEVIAPGRPAHAEVVEAFGPTIVASDGTIDRRALGAIAFSDATARERLNAIVHPRVFEEEARQIRERAPAAGDIVVTDATLLVESGYHLVFDRLVVTHCDRRQQLGRVMNRDGLSAGAAQGRIASQMPNDEKIRFGHHVIDTGRTIADTDESVRALVIALRETAASWPAPAPVAPPRAAACLEQGPREGPGALQPRTLLRAIAEAGRPPLPLLAQGLVPPSAGAWYEGALSRAARHGAETLMAPAVFWSLAWHGPDVEALLAVAVSLARLTHWRPAALAGAAVFALALREVALAETTLGTLEGRVLRHAPAIERWTGAPPPSWIMRVVGDAARVPVTNAETVPVTKVRDGDALVRALRSLASEAPAAPSADLLPAIQAIATLGRGRGRVPGAR
jgi:dephospho-CoA kinase